MGGASARVVAEPRSFRRSRDMSEQVVCYFVLAADVGALLAAGQLAFQIRFGWHTQLPAVYQLALLAAVPLTVLTFYRGRLYDFQTIECWPRWTGRLLCMVVVAALALVAVLYFLKIADNFSRAWLAATFVGGAALMVSGRGLAAAFVQRQARRGAFARAVAIIGAGAQGCRYAEHLSRYNEPRRKIVGIFDDRRTRLQRCERFQCRGDLGDLEGLVRQGRVDEVVVALPWSAEGRIVSIINRLRQLPVDVYLGSDLVAHRLPASSAGLIGGLPAYHVVRAPFSGWDGIAKRLEDVCLAAVLLVLFAPLMFVIAVAIKLDSRGPVLFRQARYGFNNERITVLKFRSMRHQPAAGFCQATVADPRITRLGGFLRRNSLDELPQLINVLAGTMSLVGPRPHPAELNEQYVRLIDGYSGRHRVKPGITGWAQIKGWRGQTDTLEKMRVRIEHDISYIENWTLWLDLRILFISAFGGWRGANAY